MKNNPLSPHVDKGSTLASKYDQLKQKRETYLSRSEQYAKATLPYVMPENQNTESDSMQHGWQSFGAKVVNHLSNKIIMTLFPPSRSFFKLSFSSDTQRELKEEGWDSSTLATELAAVESDAMTFMDSTTPRDLDIKTSKHLIITGNYMHYFPETTKHAIGVSLNQYVVKRDMYGTLLEVIILQKKALGSMPEEIKSKVKSDYRNSHIKDDTEVSLYTGGLRQPDGKYKVYQEVLGVVVGKESLMKEENIPFTILMWNHTHGEDYGRGLVEDHGGDFHVIQILSEALAKGMILMADIKYLVKPGSYTDVDHLVESPTGEFISGNIDDIGVLQLEKYADFSPIVEVLRDYERRVGEAFMVSRAARRDAERVTAYEIRQDAADLELALGGVYSHLSAIWQKPRAMRLLRMAIDNSNSGLKLGDFSPEIITGVEALGRMNELDKIMQFTEMLQMTNSWPETMQRRVQWDKFSGKVAAEIGLEIDWLMTDDQFKEMQQAEQKAMMEQKVAAEASKAVPEMIKQGGQQ